MQLRLRRKPALAPESNEALCVQPTLEGITYDPVVVRSTDLERVVTLGEDEPYERNSQDSDETVQHQVEVENAKGTLQVTLIDSANDSALRPRPT